MNEPCIVIVRYDWSGREAIYRGELVDMRVRVRDIKAGEPNPDVWLQIRDMDLVQTPGGGANMTKEQRAETAKKIAQLLAESRATYSEVPRILQEVKYHLSVAYQRDREENP